MHLFIDGVCLMCLFVEIGAKKLLRKAELKNLPSLVQVCTSLLHRFTVPHIFLHNAWHICLLIEIGLTRYIHTHTHNTHLPAAHCLCCKALALIWHRALTCYSLRLSDRLSPPRTHFEPWKAVGTLGRGSLTAR